MYYLPLYLIFSQILWEVIGVISLGYVLFQDFDSKRGIVNFFTRFTREKTTHVLLQIKLPLNFPLNLEKSKR